MSGIREDMGRWHTWLLGCVRHDSKALLDGSGGLASCIWMRNWEMVDLI